MALGAKQGDVLKLILRQGILLAAIGISVGLVASISLTRLLKTLLFEVTATDTITFVSMSTLVVVVTLLASFIPARRASRVDPMEALRYE
jgi:ABC-type antimicrobial peptide transport system permease subunit